MTRPLHLRETFTCGGVTMSRRAGETWRSAVARIAAAAGLQDEAVYAYDMSTESGELLRAWHALREWDLLERE